MAAMAPPPPPPNTSLPTTSSSTVTTAPGISGTSGTSIFKLRIYSEQLKPGQPLNSPSTYWALAHPHSLHPGQQQQGTASPASFSSSRNGVDHTTVAENHIEFDIGGCRLGLHNLSSVNFRNLCTLGLPLATAYLLMRQAFRTTPIAAGLGVGARPLVVLACNLGAPLAYGVLWTLRGRQ